MKDDKHVHKEYHVSVMLVITQQQAQSLIPANQIVDLFDVPINGVKFDVPINRVMFEVFINHVRFDVPINRVKYHIPTVSSVLSLMYLSIVLS